MSNDGADGAISSAVQLGVAGLSALAMVIAGFIVYMAEEGKVSGWLKWAAWGAIAIGLLVSLISVGLAMMDEKANILIVALNAVFIIVGASLMLLVWFSKGDAASASTAGAKENDKKVAKSEEETKGSSEPPKEEEVQTPEKPVETAAKSVPSSEPPAAEVSATTEDEEKKLEEEVEELRKKQEELKAVLARETRKKQIKADWPKAKDTLRDCINFLEKAFEDESRQKLYTDTVKDVKEDVKKAYEGIYEITMSPSVHLQILVKTCVELREMLHKFFNNVNEKEGKFSVPLFSRICRKISSVLLLDRAFYEAYERNSVQSQQGVDTCRKEDKEKFRAMFDALNAIRSTAFLEEADEMTCGEALEKLDGFIENRVNFTEMGKKSEYKELLDEFFKPKSSSA